MIRIFHQKSYLSIVVHLELPVDRVMAKFLHYMWISDIYIVVSSLSINQVNVINIIMVPVVIRNLKTVP